MKSALGGREYMTHGERTAQGYREAVKRNAAEEAAARYHRATDPLERAKAFLQRRGFVVYWAAVAGGAGDVFVVGNLRMTRDEVIAYARKRGHK